jgi:hypothetical protein
MQRVAWSLAIGTALAAGCDLPPSAPMDGPRVVGTTPALDQGLIDRDGVLRVELDRRIAPSSLADGVVEVTSGGNYIWLVQQIDVVHPAIIVRADGLFDPDITYSLRVHVLHDLDGHASTVTPWMHFHTSSSIAGTTAPRVTFADVAPVLSNCAGCHAGATAPLGLDLSTGAAVRATAVEVPAREEQPTVSGYLDTEVTAALTGMARIAPREPARSYLMYVVLGDSHIAGASMPLNAPPLAMEDIELLQRWIAAGAPTD